MPTRFTLTTFYGNKIKYFGKHLLTVVNLQTSAWQENHVKKRNLTKKVDAIDSAYQPIQ